MTVSVYKREWKVTTYDKKAFNVPKTAKIIQNNC
jgi:hypothetical protein